MGAGDGRHRSLILVFFLLCPIALGGFPLVEIARAAGECCDSQPVHLFLIQADDLSPFESDLDGVQKKSLSSSIPSEESIGSWSFNPEYHGQTAASTWTFIIHFEVENAAGVQLNATVNIDIGPNRYSGQSAAGDTYLPGGSGTLELDIEVESDTLVSSDTVSVELVMSSLVFVIPTGGARIDFMWGDDDHDSRIEGDLPLLDIDLQTPLVDGRTLHIPAILRSGFGQ